MPVCTDDDSFKLLINHSQLGHVLKEFTNTQTFNLFQRYTGMLYCQNGSITLDESKPYLKPGGTNSSWGFHIQNFNN